MSQHSGLYIANKSNFGDVPRPTGNNLIYFLNANDGDRLYAMKSNGSVFPINGSGTVWTAQGVGVQEMLVSGRNRLPVPTNSVVTYSYNMLVYNVTENTVMRITGDITAQNIGGVVTIPIVISAAITGDPIMIPNTSFNGVVIGSDLSITFGTTGSTPGNTIKYYGTVTSVLLNLNSI